MKNPFIKISLTLFAALALCACIDKREAQSSTTPAASAPQSVSLFNGKTLDGWYTYLKTKGKNNDPEKVFSVQDGLIRISGLEFGCITTDEEFENYKITLEYKWGETTCPPREAKARDSGLLLNSVGKDGAKGGVWMYSLEYNIIEGGTGDFITVGDNSENFFLTVPVAKEMDGKNYNYDPNGELVNVYKGRVNRLGKDPHWQDIKGFRGKNDIEKPHGEWNKVECVVKGGSFKSYLNGVLVNEAVNCKPQKGRIQLQSEGAEIFYRNIFIEKLN